MPDKFEYRIGERKYFQKKLVLGQIEQLVDLLEETSLPGEMTPTTVIVALKGKIYPALAIALTEDGKSPKDKDINMFAEQLKWEMDAEQLIQVVEDFFGCNPVASLLEKLTGAVVKLKGQIKAGGFRISSVPTPEETSLSETESSGDSHPESASPMSSSEKEK